MTRKKHIPYSQLIEGFREKGCELQIYGTVVERGREYPLYKFVVNPRCRKTLVITSGFHGEEANGPISLLEGIDKAVNYAKIMQVRLVVYPCVNPSAFELYKRYNGSNEKMNNYFLHYQLENGQWVGILQPGENFAQYKIVDSPAKEARILKRDILQYRIAEGILDIHQQEGLLDTGDIFAYIFDRRPTYKRIMKKLAKVAKIARNDKTFTFDRGRKILYRIDNDGFIVLHDGTLTDMFYRFGCKFVVAAETDTRMPLDKVCQVNLIWVTELIKLVAKQG